MKDHIHRFRQTRDVHPDSLAHTPLDAIAFHGFAQNASSRKAHASSSARRIARSGLISAKAEEIAHRRREILATCLVNTLIVGVLSQALVESRIWHSTIV